MDMSVEDLLLKLMQDKEEQIEAVPRPTLRRSKLSNFSTEKFPSDKRIVCPVQAKQIEFVIQSKTTQSFMVRLTLPNGEISDIMHFKNNGDSFKFCPITNGCGHGLWTIEVFRQNGFGTNIIRTKTVFLDGVGSLLYTVGDDLMPILLSKEFLHLPEACRCCGQWNADENLSP